MAVHIDNNTHFESDGTDVDRQSDSKERMRSVIEQSAFVGSPWSEQQDGQSQHLEAGVKRSKNRVL